MNKRQVLEQKHLPPSWTSSTLWRIVSDVQNTNPKKTPTKQFYYCDINSIDNTQLKITNPKLILGRDAPSRAKHEIQTGDILFSTVRTYLKNIAIVPPHLDKQVASTGFCVIRPTINKHFVFYYVQSKHFLDQMNDIQRGTNYPAVTNADVLNTVISIPPLNEQHRIVTKIESLFAQIDACKKNLEGLVSQSSSSHGSLAQLRSRVLKQAFEGKLVPQDPDDEPAEMLLKIWANSKTDPVFEKNDLPEGWIETNLENVCVVNLGQSPPSSTYNSAGNGLPFFQGKADFGNLHPETRVWCSAPKKISEKGDLLLSVRAPVGAINLSKEKCCIGRGLASIRPIDQNLDINFFIHFFSHIQNDLMQQGTGTTFKAISGKQIRALKVLLPPLSEQKRIVLKMESIFAKIDAMDTYIKSTLRLLDMLKSRTLRQAFEGKLVPQDPNDEPATRLLEQIQHGSSKDVQ